MGHNCSPEFRHGKAEAPEIEAGHNLSRPPKKTILADKAPATRAKRHYPRGPWRVIYENNVGATNAKNPPIAKIATDTQ